MFVFSDDCGDYSDERDFLCQAFAARCNFDSHNCPQWIIEPDNKLQWHVVSAENSQWSGLPMQDHTSGTSQG